MATQIFVNLPVKNLNKSVEFFSKVGYKFDPDLPTRKRRAAGGTAPMESKDYGFVYQHAFQDLDGHLWELIYMEPNAAQG